jgi:GlpG protein
MRQIGTLSKESDAQRLAAYLQTQGIAASVEPDEAERWAIWVREEDQRERAQREFEAFLAQPDDPRFQLPEQPPEEARPRRPGRLKGLTRRPAPRKRATWARNPRVLRPRPKVTLGLILLSIIVTFSSWFVQVRSDTLGFAFVRELRYVDIERFVKAGAHDPFLSIWDGEIWRLFTPIFLHFDWQHILFNMVLFYYLGSQIERIRGPLRFGLIVAATALVSNTAQAYFSSPNFGGMSGVVYGLLGYVWMKTTYEPEAGYVLDPLMFVVALAWFFLCLFNAFEDQHIANFAHAGGLLCGIALGIAPLARRRQVFVG